MAANNTASIMVGSLVLLGVNNYWRDSNMCREIKFRAWDKLKQRMCEVKNIVYLENGDMIIQATEKGTSEPLLNKKHEGR